MVFWLHKLTTITNWWDHSYIPTSFPDYPNLFLASFPDFLYQDTRNWRWKWPRKEASENASAIWLSTQEHAPLDVGWETLVKGWPGQPTLGSHGNESSVSLPGPSPVWTVWLSPASLRQQTGSGCHAKRWSMTNRRSPSVSIYSTYFWHSSTL